MKLTLDEHVQQDPRILEIYLEARRRYEKADRYHHNFPHVMRDLYRALVIAENEILEERPDFHINEEALWMNLPAELSM